MRTLYFDCFAGASGDMTLGALVGVGVDPYQLLKQLALLDVPGYAIDFSTVDRSGISATRAHVRIERQHAHRHLKDVHQIIHSSRLSDNVKERASRIFTRLAEAEARVHNVPVERVHFHEVGALDAIVDVVGACIGFEMLGVERFACSPLHLGSGMVEMAHGRFPVPPPAVIELLRDKPVYATDIKGELVTPTGAAIISTVCDSFGSMPAMRVERTGYGAGAREYERFPNVLRVILGETEADGSSVNTEKLILLETNIDDLSPQILGHMMEQAFAQGALDCFFISAQMKKNRPGVLLSILCAPADRQKMEELLFAETTTLGVRATEVERRALQREIVPVETEYGRIDVKVRRIGEVAQDGTPEYEQCRAAAQQANVPLRVVEAAARAAFRDMNRS
ncbi:MAG: nickel pincer cofactor biosynthesis protein LarC [Pyrinomonadaceae bacterium]